jgi:hypothetical protein
MQLIRKQILKSTIHQKDLGLRTTKTYWNYTKEDKEKNKQTIKSKLLQKYNPAQYLQPSL